MIRALALLLGLASPATSTELCQQVTHRGQPFTVCTADLANHRIDLHLTDASGATLGSFTAMERAFGPAQIAMNAGMYHDDRAPVGLYVEGGQQRARIVTNAGPGNFGMLPNGVFCASDTGAQVMESRSFASQAPSCRIATQSGPMLVIDGAPHPRFLPESPYRNIRNGVGASPDGTRVHFVISDAPVTFHEMATLFRDDLGVENALYLDGRVSRLHAGARSDGGRRMGPILAVRPR